MSATLHVELLGDFKLAYDGQLVTGIDTPRLQSLLAFLVLRCRTPQPRQHVAFTFWPDAGESQARNNLRQFLHQLRQTLPNAEQFIHTDASTIHWRLNSEGGVACSLDVADFERAVASATVAERRSDGVSRRAALATAVALYRGDLLPSCYDEWIAPERERLRGMFTGALKQLVDLLEQARDVAGAIPLAQRLCDLDPLDEDAHIALMRLHALKDDRAGAMRVYQAYAAALKGELGIEPGRDMRDAYERLLRRDETHSAPRTSEVYGTSIAAPLIGRQPEWERMLVSWHAAARGQPGMTLISGEAGIGKTRLAEELIIWAGQQGISLARTRAYAAEGRLAYAPVTDWLRSDAIRPSLTRLDRVWLSEVARILPELLTERTDPPEPSALNDPSKRGRFFEALARAILAAPQPLLLLLDDVQWCDQETLEWLHFLLRFDPHARLLVVGTSRVEEVVPPHPVTQWLVHLRNEGSVTEIGLEPLDAAETARLAGHIVHRALDDEAAVRLYRETEGNPLFVVEIARAGETKDLPGIQDQSGVPGVRLPPRVQAVIAGRLAQLSPAAHELAGLAATVGRAFTFDVLARASGMGDDDVIRGLDELWQRRIVRAQDANANSYDFSHDKIRDVAYAELSPMKQRRWHLRVAQALEAIHVADLDPVSAQLAAHYEQAGIAERAIAFYQRAAEVALRVFAYDEVVSLINRRLALLPKSPHNASRDEQELKLLTMFSVVRFGTGAFQVPNAFHELLRAQALSQRLGKPHSPSILRTLAYSNISRSNFRQSRQIGEQLLELAEQLRDSILIVEGHLLVGISHSWNGAFEVANKHLEQAILHYDPQYSQTHLAMYSWDPKVAGLCRLAQNSWCLGYPDQARQTQKESLRVAHTLNHPFSLSYAFFYDAMLENVLGNLESARVQVEATIACSQQYHLRWWLMLATVMRGWAVAAGGELATGIAEMERGMAELREFGTTLNAGFLSAQLAQQYVRSDQIERCLELIANVISVSEATEDRWYVTELYRVQGDALMAKGVGPQGVEAVYRRAIEIAQEQQAKSFELRATTSLARLWQAQGKVIEARSLLQPVYDWFIEGFDTHDLKEARALLDQLTPE